MPVQRTPATESGELKPTALELWLQSPFRRQLIVWGVVILVAGLSARSWYDAVSSFGGSLDWAYAFKSKLIEWSLWGLVFEPMLWLVRRATRLVRYWPLVLALHAPISYFAAEGMLEARFELRDAWLGPPSMSFERRPPRDGRRGPEREERSEERNDREDRDRRGGRGRDRDRFRPTRPDFGILIYWAMLGACWSLDAYLRSRAQQRRSVQLELRATQLQNQLVRSQLKHLRIQLQPHFLFNSLHSIAGLVRAQRTQSAITAVSNLGNVLRSILERGDQQEVRLTEELELAEQYLEIEQIRFGDRLQATTQIESGLGQCRVPNLILLPLVENAVKHGIAPRATGGRIELTARKVGDFLELTVSDDGPGFSDEARRTQQGTSSDHKPIGLMNTQKRLESLYEGQARFEILDRDGGGAQVRLYIPFRHASDPAAERES